MPEGAIASHTSGEPDPDFHTLAYDTDKQVLIFKVAAATGFDAPRAWTLASVRPGIGKEFGLQVVGRIMRVHAAVRPIHKQDGLLDSGYVFLIDRPSQAGLVEAADTLKAVKESISLVTDRLDVVELTNAPKALSVLPSDYIVRSAVAAPAPPATEAERQMRLTSLVDQGLVKDTAFALPPEEQDRLIGMGDILSTQIGLFGHLPSDRAPASTPATPRPAPNQVEYRLRRDLDLPKCLLRELPPDPVLFSERIDEIAAAFRNEPLLRDMLSKRLSLAKVDYRELLGGGDRETMDVSVRMSPELIAQKAQQVFSFNDMIDRAQLKRAIARRLMQIVREGGLDNNETDVRRAIDMTVMKKPDAINTAIRLVQGRYVRASEEQIPPVLFGSPALPPAQLGAYGVFPRT